MKKYVSLFLILTFLYVLTGCKQHTAADSERISDTPDSSVSEETAIVQTSPFDCLSLEDEFQIRLTSAQADSLKTAAYSIVSEDENEYYPVLSECSILPDKNHVIHIAKSPYVATLYFEDTDQSLLIPGLQEQQIKNTSPSWTTETFGLSGASNTPNEFCLMNLALTGMEQESDTALDYFLTPAAAGTINPFTESVAYEYWDSIYLSVHYVSELYAMPVSEWFLYDKYISYFFKYPDIKNGLDFQKKALSELQGTYYCQLALTFSDDSTIVSDWMLLQDNPGNPFEITEIVTPSETITIPAGDGEMTFSVTEDSAALTAYSGTSQTLVIPDTVNNVPVTTIAEGACSYNSTLKEIVFPETLKRINSEAFCATALDNISLPDSLEYIGGGAFGCVFIDDIASEIETLSIGKNVKWIGNNAFSGYCIRNFDISSENPYYITVDGIIYTKDQTFLCICPTGKNGVLEVPEGIIGISGNAFQNNGFFDEYINDSFGITHIILADSVQSFSCAYLPVNLQSLSIGSGLKKWKNIQDCSSLSQLEISSNNSSYCLDNGVIYNYARTELLCYLNTNTDSVFTLPDTVTLIDNLAFSFNPHIQKIIFPQGITLPDMKWSELSYSLSSITNLTGIQVENGNPAFCSRDGVLFTADSSVLICYPHGKEDVSYAVPEGVCQISQYAFFNNSTLESLSLPSSLTALHLSGENTECLEYISNLSELSINDSNPYYIVKDFFLISCLEKRLLFYVPNYYDTVFNLPDGIEVISKDIFDFSYSNAAVTEIHFPEGVTTIESGNFNDISQSDQWDILDIYLPDSVINISDSSFQNSPGIVLHASADSYAAAFAKEHDIVLETE